MHLPVEIIFKILGYLPAVDRQVAALTCWKWYSIAKSIARANIAVIDATRLMTLCPNQSAIEDILKEAGALNFSDSELEKCIEILHATCHVESLHFKHVSCGMMLPRNDLRTVREKVLRVGELQFDSCSIPCDVLLGFISHFELLHTLRIDYVQFYHGAGASCAEKKGFVQIENMLELLRTCHTTLRSLSLSHTDLSSNDIRAICEVDGLALTKLQVSNSTVLISANVVDDILRCHSVRTLQLSRLSGCFNTRRLENSMVSSLTLYFAQDGHSGNELSVSSLPPCLRVLNVSSLPQLVAKHTLPIDGASTHLNMVSFCLTEYCISTEELENLCHVCSQLETLAIYLCTKLAGNCYQIISRLSRMKSLTLHSFGLNDSIVLGCSSEIIMKDVKTSTYERFSQKIASAALHQLSSLSRLELLDIDGIQRDFTDASLKYSFHLPRLRCLRLAPCRGITDRGLEWLAPKMPLLLTLRLHSAPITDRGLERLLTVTKRLHDLSLVHCTKLTPACLQVIKAHSRYLHELSIRDCMSDPPFDRICGWDEMESLIKTL